MKFLIYLEVCVIAAFASPFLDDVNVAQKLVRIPDGFGGMKYVNPNAEQDPSPSYIPADDVEFLLFTLQNPLIPQFLRFDDMSSVANSNWSPNRPTKVICHGWQRSEIAEADVISSLIVVYFQRHQHRSQPAGDCVLSGRTRC